jgi:hypothetical protein
MRLMQVLAVIGLAAVYWCLVELAAMFRAYLQQRRWQAQIDDWSRDIR